MSQNDRCRFCGHQRGLHVDEHTCRPSSGGWCGCLEFEPMVERISIDLDIELESLMLWVDGELARVRT